MGSARTTVSSTRRRSSAVVGSPPGVASGRRFVTSNLQLSVRRLVTPGRRRARAGNGSNSLRFRPGEGRPRDQRGSNSSELEAFQLPPSSRARDITTPYLLIAPPRRALLTLVALFPPAPALPSLIPTTITANISSSVCEKRGRGGVFDVFVFVSRKLIHPESAFSLQLQLQCVVIIINKC